MTKKNHKIKICHFADHLTGTTDGIFTHILSIIEFSDKEKYEHYLCYQGGQGIENRVHQVGGKTSVFKNINKKIPIKAFHEFVKLCNREKFSIIHTHYLKPYIISGILKPIYGYKLIYNYHGAFINNNYNSTIEKKIYMVLHWINCKLNIINLVLAPSYSCKDRVLKESAIIPRIEVYYNTAFLTKSDSEQTSETVKMIQELSKKYFLVGIVARQAQQKRIDLALRILKEIKRRYENILFVFCGDGELEMEMKKLAVELKLESDAQFFGYVEDINMHLNLFKLLLFSSDYEGFPLTIWEAMNAGIPIVSTDVGGIKEIVEIENCGIMYERGNIIAGAEAILKLIENTELREKMGENGKNAFVYKYNADSFGARMNSIYKSLITN